VPAPALRLRFFNDPPLIAKYRVRWMDMNAQRKRWKGSRRRRRVRMDSMEGKRGPRGWKRKAPGWWSEGSAGW